MIRAWLTVTCGMLLLMFLIHVVFNVSLKWMIIGYLLAVVPYAVRQQ